MKIAANIVVVLAVASMIVLPDETWAPHGGGQHSGPRSGHGHHHVHRTMFAGG
jgi:hypothetical protein